MSLRADVEIVIGFLSDKNFDIHPTVEQELILDGEKLTIPGRVYFDKPDDISFRSLTKIQQTIINCIYLRHHDGYIRQERLEKLTGQNEYFITPFVFQLLGESVVEILDVIDKQVDDSRLKNFARIVEENPKYWMQTESRMISYWNEYYRRSKYPRLKNYVGFKIIKKIKNEHTTMAKINKAQKVN